MPRSRPADGGLVVVTPSELARRPLPQHADGSSKYDRGRVLIAGGSRQTPGSVLLAGLAALRAGAGKLQLATAASVAPALAVAVPEARAVSLDETPGGDIDPAAAPALQRLVAGADAVVTGTGVLDVEGAGALLRVVVDAGGDAVLVVDAGALPVLADQPGLLGGAAARTVVMPNFVEMAGLLDCPVDEVEAEPARCLAAAVERLGAVVTLRGAESWTAAPDAPVFLDRSGDIGLATSGSGDVLAGVIGGLAARGAGPLTAVLWANRVHALAGARCAEEIGTVGYLARELLGHLPYAIDHAAR